jgi:hypothetical protein
MLVTLYAAAPCAVSAATAMRLIVLMPLRIRTVRPVFTFTRDGLNTLSLDQPSRTRRGAFPRFNVRLSSRGATGGIHKQAAMSRRDLHRRLQQRGF